MKVESLLRDYMRPYGEQFNPLATVVADVILTCDTERGPGYHSMPVNPNHLRIRSLIVPCTLVDDRAEGGVGVSEERESRGRQEEARAKTGLQILYARRREAEDRPGDVAQQDIPRELREQYWIRQVGDAGIEGKNWTFGISMPRWIERHELDRTRNEPGDGFRYVFRRGTDGARSRAEWFEVTEVFEGVEPKDIEAFMRVNNGGTAGFDFDPDRFVRGLEMGTPGRKAQQRAADRVIAAVEKKVSKASYEGMWRRHGYGTLIVGLPLWFATGPADPLRVENVMDDFTTRVRIGLAVCAANSRNGVARSGGSWSCGCRRWRACASGTARLGTRSSTIRRTDGSEVCRSKLQSMTPVWLNLMGRLEAARADGEKVGGWSVFIPVACPKKQSEEASLQLPPAVEALKRALDGDGKRRVRENPLNRVKWRAIQRAMDVLCFVRMYSVRPRAVGHHQVVAAPPDDAVGDEAPGTQGQSAAQCD